MNNKEKELELEEDVYEEEGGLGSHTVYVGYIRPHLPTSNFR